jgi:hypothetical protein
MPESSALTEIARSSAFPADGQSSAFAKLRELTRNGYFPVAGEETADGGILLRHDQAPDLVLHADGRLDLPISQAAKPAKVERKAAREKRIYWLRTLFVVAMTVAVWFLSVILTAGLLESMG